MPLHPDEGSHRAYRFPAGIPAELHEGGRTFPCVAENLSRTGTLLVGPLPSPSQKLVDLTLKTPGGTYKASFRGQVVRVDPDPGQDGLRVALVFAGVDAAQRDALEILIARFLEGHAPPPLPELKPGMTPLEIKKALDAIPLSQRIGLAVRASQKEREVLRLDQNPPVLEALIRNPNLLLLEARALASAAYLQPGTIDVLAADPRFAKDDEVRVALASHPHVTPATAEKLAEDLHPPQIRLLMSRATLNPVLRRKLRKKLVGG